MQKSNWQGPAVSLGGHWGRGFCRCKKGHRVYLAYYVKPLLKCQPPAVIDAGLASGFGSITHEEDKGKMQNVYKMGTLLEEGGYSYLGLIPKRLLRDIHWPTANYSNPLLC